MQAHSGIDPSRQGREGFPEFVYCEGKTDVQVADNLRALHQAHRRAFGTRLPAERAASRAQILHHPRALMGVVGELGLSL